MKNDIYNKIILFSKEIEFLLDDTEKEIKRDLYLYNLSPDD